MTPFISALFYVFVFLSMYVQVFLLVTFFENRSKIRGKEEKIKLKNYPEVAIIVPCWNEESTVYRTVQSIFDLNYPSDKIDILLIDDGSTDNTWQVLQNFSKHKNVRIFQKENGGKHTALNMGLELSRAEYVACLDADSRAEKDSLLKLVNYFNTDPEIMAVSPSIIVENSKTFIQHAQRAEYHMSVYIKKILGFLGAIHVTPGPLTLFKKKVFEDLGPYKHAHNTEDMEIAYRMQKHYYKIEQCHDAIVYTNTPNSAKKLYKQRLRWLFGFINNSIDYKDMIFRKKYGHFSFFTLPAGLISILASCVLFLRMLYLLGESIYNKALEINTVGFEVNVPSFTFDPFFLNTHLLSVITVLVFLFMLFSIVVGRKMASEKGGFARDVVSFFLVFTLLSPLWLLKALYNTLVYQKPAWR